MKLLTSQNKKHKPTVFDCFKDLFKIISCKTRVTCCIVNAWFPLIAALLIVYGVCDPL